MLYRKRLKLSLFVLLLFTTLTHDMAMAIRTAWLSIASSGLNDVLRVDSCQHLLGLVPRQKKICIKHLDLMDSVKRGAKRAIDECQNQFRSRRWNCSEIDQATVFGPVMSAGTRETAFIYAISSAGVAWEVTRACSNGQLLRKCGCDRSVRGPGDDFEWSGCSDNVDYGIGFARRFIDAREKVKRKRSNGARARPLMNLHNNFAGRNTIKERIRNQCKCHGVSGSCEIKTCWKSMPNFQRIGEVIKQKFDGATEVRLHKQSKDRFELVPKDAKFKRHTHRDLVYLVASPDYCEHDRDSGSLGTSGRRCNASSAAIDGCDLLCCQRGYNTIRRTVMSRCECKFMWCCHVKCKQCSRVVEENTCK